MPAKGGVSPVRLIGHGVAARSPAPSMVDAVRGTTAAEAPRWRGDECRL